MSHALDDKINLEQIKLIHELHILLKNSNKKILPPLAVCKSNR